MKIYNAVNFFEEVDAEAEDYTIHLVSFIIQTFLGPKKMSLIADVAMFVGFLLAEQWGPMLYIGVPFIPALLLEWGVYPFMPELDTPPIPFELWFDEIMNNEPWFDSKVEERVPPAEL